MRLTILISLACGIILLWNSCSVEAKNSGTAPSSSLNVEVYRAETSPYEHEFSTTARIMAGEQVELKAPTSGQVLAIHFTEGGKIQKGGRIVRLDDRIWSAQLQGVNAEIQSAESDLDRKQQLLSIEGSSQEEVDMALSALALLKAQKQQLEVNIGLANVKAPFAGSLGMRNFSIGAFLNQGDVLTTLTDSEHLKIDFDLPQTALSSVEVGKEVLLIVDNDTTKATIYAVNPQVDIQSRTISVRAKAEQHKDHPIMAGSFGEVRVNTDRIENAILIPTQAVVPSINEQTVYMIKNGKAVRKVIEMGDRTADKVLVTKGISEGDSIVTTGLLQIKEGMDITIQRTIN